MSRPRFEAAMTQRSIPSPLLNRGLRLPPINLKEALWAPGFPALSWWAKGAHPLPHIPPSLLPVFGSEELLPGSKSRLLVVEEGYNLQTWNLRRKNQPANVAAEHASEYPSPHLERRGGGCVCQGERVSAPGAQTFNSHCA